MKFSKIILFAMLVGIFCCAGNRVFATNQAENKGLIGRIYDLKCDTEGVPVIDFDDIRKRQMNLSEALKILNKNFSNGDGSWNLQELGSKWYRADGKKRYAKIFFERDLCKKFFEKNAPRDSKKSIESPGVLLVISGKFSVPESGQWRFVGNADDIMLVAVGSPQKKQTVLCAFYPREGNGLRMLQKKKKVPARTSSFGQSSWSSQSKKGRLEPTIVKSAPALQGKRTIFNDYFESDGRIVPNSEKLMIGLYKGQWLDLKKGVEYEIIIACGEATGSLSGFVLGMQNKAIDTDDNFPMFTVEQVRNSPAGTKYSMTGRYNISCSFSPTNPQRFNRVPANETTEENLEDAAGTEILGNEEITGTQESIPNDSKIRRDFFGLILGKSTGTEVLQQLEFLGYSPKVLEDKIVENAYSIGCFDFKFADVYWKYVSFSIYNNKLASISFTSNERERYEYQKLLFGRLKEGLLKKYEEYLVSKKDSPDKIYMSDSVISIFLSLDIVDGVFLLYSNKELTTKYHEIRKAFQNSDL